MCTDRPFAAVDVAKLSSECRGLVLKVRAALEGAPTSAAAAGAFVALWDDLQMLMHTHMRHEDEVIFPAADGWMPHHSDPFEEVRLCALRFITCARSHLRRTPPQCMQEASLYFTSWSLELYPLCRNACLNVSCMASNWVHQLDL